MNTLIVGHGAGSWQMRGVQLGAALQARVTSVPTAVDWDWAERVVFVKREGLRWVTRAQTLGVPVIWDALDFWRQPLDHAWSASAARAALGRMLETIRPTQTIGATLAMAQDAGGVYVEHHGRLGLHPTPARPDCRVVGYDGNPAYLDAWRGPLQTACQTRGWTFVINPPDLAAVDLLVALRGGRWDGWVCRQWKSGVKAVNAILAGRPLLHQDTAATRELDPCGTVVATVADLPAAFDAWTPYATRQHVVDVSWQRYHAFTVEAVAAHYARVLARTP